MPGRNALSGAFLPGLLALGQVHPQHAVFEVSIRLSLFRVVRNGKIADETTVVAFNAAELTPLLFLLGLTLA